MEQPLEETTAPKEGILTRLRRIVVVAVILALAGLTVFLLAERNSRLYFLGTEGDALIVSRGARLPWGKRAWTPEEPSLADAYAPMELPAGTAPLPVRRFDERQELDRALFDILAGWAESRVRTDDPLSMREGLGFVKRAGLLSGITSEQQQRLRRLRAEVAYFEGRDRLEKGGRLLEEAREQLVLATEAQPARAREAVAILDELEPSLERLARALQMARGLRDAIPAPAGPKAAPPGAEPAPAAAPPVEAPQQTQPLPQTRQPKQVEPPVAEDAEDAPAARKAKAVAAEDEAPEEPAP